MEEAVGEQETLHMELVEKVVVVMVLIQQQKMVLMVLVVEEVETKETLLE